jgi:hypothetical protein
VPVDEQQPRTAAIGLQGGKRTQDHRAIAAHQQREPAAAASGGNRVANWPIIVTSASSASSPEGPRAGREAGSTRSPTSVNPGQLVPLMALAGGSVVPQRTHLSGDHDNGRDKTRRAVKGPSLRHLFGRPGPAGEGGVEGIDEAGEGGVDRLGQAEPAGRL